MKTATVLAVANPAPINPFVRPIALPTAPKAVKGKANNSGTLNPHKILATGKKYAPTFGKS